MVYSTGNVLIDSSADLPLEIQFRIRLDSLKTSNSLPVEFNENTWTMLQRLKNEINLIYEKMRDDKIIKSGLETKIYINTKNKLKNIFDKIDLSDFLVCSSVELNNGAIKKQLKSLDGIEDIQILVEKAKGKKCERCWKIFENECERCLQLTSN